VKNSTREFEGDGRDGTGIGGDDQFNPDLLFKKWKKKQ